MGGIVFINYRRKDAEHVAGRLFDRLEQHFPPDQLFFDVDNIPPGEDFVAYLNRKVEACDVLLALIGPNWESQLDATDYDSGAQSKDFARIEIEAALAKGKKVVPVLVSGAEMPREENLPKSLRPFARRNAVRLSHERFSADAAGITNALKAALVEAEELRAAAATEAARQRAEEERKQKAAQEAKDQAVEEEAQRRGVAGLSPEQIAKAEELAHWEFIKESENAQEFRDHLARFSEGVTERMARSKLEAVVYAQLGDSPPTEALDRFLTEFRDGKLVAKARAKRRQGRELGSEQVAAQGRERANRHPDKEAGHEHPVQDTKSATIATPVPPQPSIMPSLGILGGLATLLAIGIVVQSQVSMTEPATVAEATTLDTGDTAWIIGATILPLATVIPALALFYGGLTGTRNLPFAFVRVLSIFGITAMVWVAWAYSLCFTEGNPFIGGFSRMLLAGVTPESLSGTIPEYVFILFLMAHACMIAAMVAGAFIGRMTFAGLLMFTALWITLVFSPITHWIWGGGWLGELGVLDFAGGLNSFVAAGAAGVIGCVMIGAPADEGKRGSRSDTNLTLLGASLLWLGWLGLIAGSYLAASGNAPATILNLIAATFAAALTWFFMEWIVAGQSSPLGLMWGAIAGLAAFAPASGFVVLTGSFLLGIVAALACFVFAGSMKKRDVLLRVFGTYLIGGIVGMLGTGVFAVEAFGGIPGLVEGNLSQVVIQAWGVLLTLAWSAGVTYLILFAMKRIVGLQSLH